MKASVIFSLIFVFFCTVANAQQATTQEAPASITLADQFNSLKKKSNTFKERNISYKVVRLRTLDSFWKSVQDTIKAREQQFLQAQKATEQELLQARANMEDQNSQLQTLKQENAQKEQAVQKSAYDIANISVLGMDMQKQTFVILSWGVIVILLIILGVIMFLYKNSKQVTDEKRKAFEEIDQEYKEYKQNARERELKVKRELQTEMNRVEELNQQIALLKKQAHT